MPSWNSEQYLKFARERTQPALDLAARLDFAGPPRRVIDFGCGPGNSTKVLWDRWPGIDLTGLDNAASMLASAQQLLPEAKWIESDISNWATNVAPESYDLVFSNAAFQWVPDHAALLPRLMATVAVGGALAFQVPANFEAPPHRLMRELGATETWRTHFTTTPREWQVNDVGFYYDALTPLASRVELWTTDYLHQLADVDGIIEWYRGTGLRPWLDALPDDAMRTKFLADYRELLAPHFPRQADGRVLFPFRRLFVVAYR